MLRAASAVVAGAAIGVLPACRGGSDDVATSPAAPGSGAFEGKIVNLGFEDETVALGYTPVAAWALDGDQPWYPYMVEHLADTEPIFGYPPNIESILVAAPELVIAPKYLKSEMGDQLAKIAPTTYIPYTNLGGSEGSKEQLWPVAEALGVVDEAEVIYDEYLGTIASAKETLAETVDGTIAFVRIGAKEFRLVTMDHGYVGPTLYKDLGLTPPPFLVDEATKDTNGYGWVPMSLEVLPDLNPDILLYNSGDKATLDDMLASPLYQTLDAVKNDRTYAFNLENWAIVGILAEQAKIDEVLAALG